MGAQNQHTSAPVHQMTLTEERVRVLYRGMPLSIFVTLMLELLLSYSHWNIIGRGDLILWNMLMMCTMILRIANWFLWRNTRTNVSAQYWLTSFRVGAVFAGLMWGSSCYFMFASYNPAYQALLAFTLAGVSSGSLTTLGIDKISVVGFVTLAIIPLSVRLYAEDGQIALSMSTMSFMFIIFVLSVSARARAQMQTNFEKNARLIDWGNERLQQQQMSKIISQAQALFIAEDGDNKTLEHLLESTLEFTGSKFGFIADVLYTEENKPYLNMVAMTNIAWDKRSRAAYADYKTHGMKFTNLDTLFGVAVTTGKPIISNHPATDMRAAGVPPGHAVITSFIGIPIFNNTQQIAMLGLANKENGYSDDQPEQLQPITNLIVQFSIANGHKRQHLIDKENIKRQAAHTQAILDGAFDGIITLDEHGTIISFNHAAEAIFGYSAEQIIGNRLLRLLSPKSQPKNKNIGEHPNITALDREVIGLRKNGKEFEMELSLSMIHDQGTTTHVGVIRDISDRKHTDKLKNEFIATVSHELRTPLTSISASLAIIESGSLGVLPEKIGNLIQIAKQNSLRLQNLINDLLDMDRLLSNKIEFEYKKFDAIALVQNTIAANQYIANKHQVKFQIGSASNNCYIHADETRTQQVLSHMFSNAAKFSNPHSLVDISISSNSKYIKISVSDHGIGIASEFKPNIFSPFTQADSSSTRRKDGSGIGLAISKELIEKMGGQIGFTSNPGEGSCFYFELPIAKI